MTALNDTRLQLHWAAQAAAGVGRTLLAQRADDSHSSFCWSPRAHALVQEAVDGAYRSGIRLRDLTLLLLDHGEEVVEEYPLCGHTLEEGFHFYEERAGRTIARPPEELPEHAVARGGVFAPLDGDLVKFDDLYDEAAQVLEGLRTKVPNAGPVRVWPHHFDMATMIDLGAGRGILAGFVPGDEQFPSPYWYVNAWPAPAEAMNLPPLSIGSWNTDRWFGAVLLDAATCDRDAIAQFLDEAVAACVRLVGG